jgi:uncharacterized MAPEG superfamily protein
MLLLFALWTLLLLVFTVGVYRWGNVLLHKAQLRDFTSDNVQGSDFYKRAMRAHANCVENLPIFTAIVFAVYVTQTSSEWINTLSIIIVVARVLQSLVHVCTIQTNRIVFIRFCLFLAQLVSFIGIALIVINATWL